MYKLITYCNKNMSDRVVENENKETFKKEVIDLIENLDKKDFQVKRRYIKIVNELIEEAETSEEYRNRRESSVRKIADYIQDDFSKVDFEIAVDIDSSEE